MTIKTEVPPEPAKRSSPLAKLLLRSLLWFLTKTFYRLRVDGRDNVPATGGALLVCNHLSLVDALLLAAACRRPHKSSLAAFLQESGTSVL